MDVLEQVETMLCTREKTESKKRTDQEINMAVLLHDATRLYVELLREGQTQSARERLVDICQLVNAMIRQLPTR